MPQKELEHTQMPIDGELRIPGFVDRLVREVRLSHDLTEMGRTNK